MIKSTPVATYPKASRQPRKMSISAAMVKLNAMADRQPEIFGDYRTAAIKMITFKSSHSTEFSLYTENLEFFYSKESFEECFTKLTSYLENIDQD